MTSSRARAFRLTCAFAFAAALFAPGVAHAQRTAQDIETARQLYNQGIQLRDKGDLKGALDKLRAAHALGNTPITGIELCRTYAALRQPVEAREVCLGVARIAPTAQETQRSQEARSEAGRIAEAERPKIGALRIKLRGVDATAEPLVLVDGAAIPPAALTEPRAVNPGAHVVTAKVGSGRETRADVETKEGETKDLELVVEMPPPEAHPTPVGPAPLTPANDAPPDNRRTLATVAFVIGGVAAVVGIAGGLKAMSGESDLEKSCVAKKCGTELHDDLSSAKTWGNVSTAAFVISGIAVAGGLIALLSAPKVEKHAGAPVKKAEWHPVLGLGGVGVHGSF